MSQYSLTRLLLAVTAFSICIAWGWPRVDNLPVRTSGLYPVFWAMPFILALAVSALVFLLRMRNLPAVLTTASGAILASVFCPWGLEVIAALLGGICTSAIFHVLTLVARRQERPKAVVMPAATMPKSE